MWVLVCFLVLVAVEAVVVAVVFVVVATVVVVIVVSSCCCCCYWLLLVVVYSSWRNTLSTSINNYLCCGLCLGVGCVCDFLTIVALVAMNR